MTPLTEHTGRSVTLRRDNVDTDQIIPAEYCKRLTKSGYADGLFAGWRADPQFVLNQPESAGASILLAADNFGTGSSREHAVWALRDWGFAAVLATSYGDIFRRNAFKNGLLAIELPDGPLARLADAVAATPEMKITVDLVNSEVTADGQRYKFAIDERARWLLLNGLDEIATTLAEASAIEAYEAARHHWLPSLRPAAAGPAEQPRQEVRA